MLRKIKENRVLAFASLFGGALLIGGTLASEVVFSQEESSQVPEGIVPVANEDGEEITTVEPKGEEWEQVECTTEGCRYRHRITGRVLFLLKKVAQTPGKVLGISPKSSSTQKPSTQNQSAGSVETSNEKEGLRYSFSTYDEMTKAFQKAKDDGAKYVIIQLGNLEGCPPCQAVNRAVERNLLSKRTDIAVMDFNAFQNRESDVLDFFYNKISAKFKIYRGFSFPQIYVMYLETNSNWWNFKYTINGQTNSVETVMKGIEQIVNRSVESLSEESQRQKLTH